MVRGFCAALVAALVFPAAAAAHTDFGPQLAFAWPAQGMVTSPFGRDGYRWHPGLDIGSLRSLDIRAASAGVVAQTGYITGYDGYGDVVVVNLGGGFSALYAHLSRTVARVGQQVLPGQLLGIAGCTGWCTGTHLHFELRYRGRPIDPAPLMTAQVLG
jgi:murein DD-endopeptidase MepM/ murein hydrolase activator NlpD